MEEVFRTRKLHPNVYQLSNYTSPPEREVKTLVDLCWKVNFPIYDGNSYNFLLLAFLAH